MTDTAPEVTVPQALPLVTVPNVELMHTGTWKISTGTFTFTSTDFANAVAALDCPGVHRAVIKLGHDEPDPDENKIRWDGEPALGFVNNMGATAYTLFGDLTGMPGWLTPEVLASAYPHRSIEGQYDHVCQLGHTHPFVITAVALLGVVPPGIGTLQSLQDVAALYGVTDTGSDQVAAATDPAPTGGPSFTVTVHAARQEAAVPNPNPTTVRAGVTTDDVRRAFYSSDYGKGWDIWICEIQLGPDLQIIAIDDSTGKLQRVPITVGDGDGEDAVEFGEPVTVVVRYEDAQVAAAAGGQVLRYASRDEARPGSRPAQATAGQDGPSDGTPEAGQLPATDDQVDSAAQERPESQEPQDSPPVRAGANTHQEGAAMLDAAKLREALGLSPEASDDEVRAALTEQGVTPTQPDPEPEAEPTEGGDGDGDGDGEGGEGGEGEDAPAGQPATQAATLPPGTVAIDESALADLREKAEQGVAARAQQKREDRDRTLDAAIKAGKFPPARRAHWETYWATDEDGARAAIASLAEGLVPVEDAGAPGGEPTDTYDDVDRLFSVPVPKGA